jgi:uncharacterized membrane protein YdfJ with MMPL/SSD domain
MVRGSHSNHQSSQNRRVQYCGGNPLRNPRDMLVLDKVAGAIFRVPGIERVQSITRPLGPPIEDGSIPFQLSVQSAPIRDNLNYLKARVGDIKKITGFLDTQITLLERQYAVTQKLANAADDSSKTTGETAAITDEIRDHIADFDDFWRPIAVTSTGRSTATTSRSACRYGRCSTRWTDSTS